MYNQPAYGQMPTNVNSIFTNALSGYKSNVNEQGVNNSKPFNMKEKKTLTLEQPLDFPSQIETQMMTTYDLSKLINTFFGSSVSDYEGCICTIDQMSKLNVELYFREKQTNDPDKTTTIKRVTDGLRGNGMNRAINPAQMIQNISSVMASNSRLYTLTDDAKEYLYDFIIRDSKVPFEKINWNQYCVEQHDQMYNMQTVYVKVTGIDINAILKTIFGNRRKVSNDKYSYFDYSISVVRPIGVGYTSNQNFLITVQRFDQHEVEKLASKVGLVSTIGNIPIIRDVIM